MSVAVTFEPDGDTFQVRRNQSLLTVIRQAGRPIGFSCRGQGVCTACAVWVNGQVSEISDLEAGLLARLPAPQGRAGFQQRIACLVRIQGPTIVTADYW